VEAFNVARNKVHVTGFSQGAFASWSMLCHASDIVCSIAPLASSGQDNWGSGYRQADGKGSFCFKTGSGPTHKRSIMYHSGKHDALASFNLFSPTVNYVKDDYGITSGPTTLGSSSWHNWKRFDGPHGIRFEKAWYKYTGWLLAGVGHCFPNKRTSSSGSGFHMCHTTLGANHYDWGVSVIKFFQSNPCQPGA